MQVLTADVQLQPTFRKHIAIDFKTLSLGDEFLVIIIVASPNNIACFDLAYSDTVFLESGLKNLFENGSILKVRPLTLIILSTSMFRLFMISNVSQLYLLNIMPSIFKMFSILRSIFFAKTVSDVQTEYLWL